MRIISGKHKGKRLIAPAKLPVRPTTDQAKEALFNILNNYYHFEELSILDLFSGTGNISYEFAARGAENITAVDANFDCVKFIKKTAAELEFPITTIKSDVFKYLQKVPVKADIIFADPPYAMEIEKFTEIASLVFENNMLKDGGFLILEHSKQMELDQVPHFKESRRYGSSVFSFFEN